TPGARLELLLDEPELPLCQPETFDIVLEIRIGIREEDLRRCLLNDGAADAAFQDVACALGGQAHHPIQLAPCLGAILREALEHRIREQPPEFVHPAHELTAIEQLSDEMKEVQSDRPACDLVTQKVRDVKAH